MNKKNIKKASALFLTMCISAPVINIYAQPLSLETPVNETEINQKSVKISGINYIIKDLANASTYGTVSVSNNQYITTKNVVIPSEISIDGYKYRVTEIGSNAFRNNQNIESIVIGKYIEKININAFNGCDNFKKYMVEKGNSKFSASNDILYNYKGDTIISVPKAKNLQNFSIPSLVTKIGDYAFYNLNSLEGITLNSELKEIGDYAFADCNNLKAVSMNNELISIGNYAFSRTNIKSMQLSRKLIKIGEGAFFSSSLKSISIPSDVTSIEKYTFYNCTNLNSVSLNTKLTNIDSYAFSNTSIDEIKIPDSVVEIGYAAFAECKNLETISLGRKLKVINDYAFYNCTNMPSITLPETLTTLGEDAFKNCTRMKKVEINGTNKYFSVIGDVLYNREGTILIFYPPSRPDSEYEIPSQLEEILPNALSNCMYIEEFTVNASNTYFTAEDGVLFDKNKTTLIKFPQGKDEYNYTIPNFVEKISSYAFAGSVLNGTLNISDNVSEIGDFAFNKCEYINGFSVSNKNNNFEDENSVLYNSDKTTLIQYPIAKKESSYKLPDSVTAILTGALSDTKLKEIKLNTKLELISEGAFKNSSIKSLVLPDSLKTIESYAFSESSLEDINIPENVTEIGDFAFSDCENLKSITFDSESNLQNIGNNVFSGSRNIVNILVPEYTYKTYRNIFKNMNLFNIEELVKEYKTEQGNITIIEPNINGTNNNEFYDEFDNYNIEEKKEEKATEYTVQPNDTITIISEKVYGDKSLYSKILKANNLDGNAAFLYVGQKLIIPPK